MVCGMKEWIGVGYPFLCCVNPIFIVDEKKNWEKIRTQYYSLSYFDKKLKLICHEAYAEISKACQKWFLFWNLYIKL